MSYNRIGVFQYVFLVIFFVLSDGVNDDFKGSQDLFRNAFESGFPWELLKVLSGPPGPVIFTWRHWANFKGSFAGSRGQGDLIELYGLSRVIVNDDLKIQKVEVGILLIA